MLDKFKAIWVSHSSISDFKKCPRAYYLRNIYKQNGRKISIASPYLSLGVAVHNCLENLAWIKKEDRLKESLINKFEKEFDKYKGKIGGFTSNEKFLEFKGRGVEMMKIITNSPGPIIRPAVRMLQDRNELPWLWLSEKDEIILCGKADWLEYDNGNISVYDFKTNASETEHDDSIQLPIYSLLVEKYKKSPLTRAFYWYIAQLPTPTEKTLPTKKESYNMVYNAAMKLAEARRANKLSCPYNGCRNCEPYERILKGEGEKLGVGEYKQELYYL